MVCLLQINPSNISIQKNTGFMVERYRNHQLITYLKNYVENLKLELYIFSDPECF